MHPLASLFQPVTAQSAAYQSAYIEIPPEGGLAPYVACLWARRPGLPCPAAPRPILVVPDGCTDLLFTQDWPGGPVHCRLSNLMDVPFYSLLESASPCKLLIAARLPFWSAHLFLENAGGETATPPWLLTAGQALEDCATLAQRAAVLQACLRARLRLARENPDLLNAAYALLRSGGAASAAEICAYACVSPRRMQRLFQRQVGLSLKRIAGVVRYQNVWRAMLQNQPFDVQEAVLRLGYTDQAHLLNAFKRHHGLNPTQARRLCRI